MSLRYLRMTVKESYSLGLVYTDVCETILISWSMFIECLMQCLNLELD